MNSSDSISKKRVKKSLDGDFAYHHLALSRSNNFLRKHDSERLPMYVMFVDLVGSTKMSANLSPDILNVIIRTFSQEMANVIESFDGYVLKFVGDAVLGYFVPQEKTPNLADRVISCANMMHNVVDNVINQVLEDDKFPILQIKVSIDFGDCSIVRYGADKNLSHIDLIGLTLNLASKMQNITKPNQITIGQFVYSKLTLKTKKLFKNKKTDPKKWSFAQLKNKHYLVYQSTVES
ncbi:MAG: adenylate/guanylate cyclase domain-containing protein [Candidatus Nitrosopumilus sp. bin_68KS]